jgi:hypothetical protein
MKNPALWDRLQQFNFDGEDVPFGFVRRLARDNRWSQDFAARVVEEYRKFAYLAVTAGHEVTPSDEVDQAWHLHLTYTRNYWGVFRECLGTELHHGPTTGTTSDKERFDDNYEKTLATYEREFGVAAPADIWPPAHIRFGEAPYYQRLNTRNRLILPVPSIIQSFWRSATMRVAAVTAVVSLALMPAAQAFFEVEAAGDNSGKLVAVGVTVAVGLMLFAVGLSRANKKAGKDNSGGGGTGCSGGTNNSGGKSADGGEGGSGCGSGCGGCGGG